MGKIDENAYLPCMKCDSWVPCYAEEIHTVECHHLGVSQFSHSYIKGSSLYAEAITISGSDGMKKSKISLKDKLYKKSKKNGDTSSSASKKNEKSAADINKKKFEEPEWLKKVFPSYHYQIVLMNERDMIRCNICAYTPVVLEYDCNSCAFLAVPDEHVRIGHIVLHENGCSEHFPSLESTAMVMVKNISKVEVAKEIVFNTNKDMTDKERLLAEQQLKFQLLSNCPLGSDFTLNMGRRVQLYSSDRSDLVYKITHMLPDTSITDSVSEDLISQMQNIGINCSSNSAFDEDSTVPSQLLTLDEYKCSETSALASDFSKLQLSSSNSSDAFITIDECDETTAADRSQVIDFDVLTSTPNKKSSSVSSKSLLVTGTRKKILYSLEYDEAQSQWRTLSESSGEWVRVGKDTKISVIPNCKSTSDDAEMESKGSNEDEYYKGHTYDVLLKIMENKFRNADTIGNPLLGGWSGVLLHGPPGTGKTSMVEHAAAEMNVPLFSLSLSHVMNRSAGEESLFQRFKVACESAPSVFFMDEVDSFCPTSLNKSGNKNDVLAAIIRGIQILQESIKPVLLVAATSRPEAVAAKLLSPGRLDKLLLVPLPDAEQRVFILQKLLLSHRHSLTQEEIKDIAKKAYGFSGADLSVLIKTSWVNYVEKREEVKNEEGTLELKKEDLCKGLSGVVPTMMRQNQLAISKVHWDDIWGYEVIKSKLQKIMHLHLGNPKLYPLTGLLLYGPPGCSKTMFVRALVSETNFSFFPLKCSNLLSKYVGETEKSLSKVFTQAEQAAPSIIFMDEIDSLCSDRSGGSMLVSELLSLISGTKRKNNIWIIGATNRPAAVDEALIQPGRLEQIVHVDLPDLSSRLEIWKNLLSGVPIKGEVDVTKLSECTAGYSGAEIISLYQEAASTALASIANKKQEEYTQCAMQTEHTAVPYVTEELILKTIRFIPSRTPSSLLQTISLFTNQRKHLL